MTIHYHGTPITPQPVLNELAGRCFCVSFAAPWDVERVHAIGQSVMLDNGAFSMWTRGKAVNWADYYAFCDIWLDYATTWAVIPDIIEGDAAQQDDLLSQWPFGQRGAPVWHLHEPIDRLLALADSWQRICFGSSAEYAVVESDIWRQRVSDAFDALAVRHRRLPWLHMLRGMKTVGKAWPFASVDSTDIARNHSRSKRTARQMADRWDRVQCPPNWALEYEDVFS